MHTTIKGLPTFEGQNAQKEIRMPNEKESLGVLSPRLSAMRFFKEVESVFNRARPKRHLLGKHKKKQIFLRNAFLEKSKQKIIKQWIKEQIDKTRNDYYNLNKIRQKNKMPKNI